MQTFHSLGLGYSWLGHSRLGKWRLAVAGLAVSGLAACQTTGAKPVRDGVPEPVVSLEIRDLPRATPRALPPPAPVATRPPAPATEAPEEPVVETGAAFAGLAGWEGLDAAPALAAFRRSCTAWERADDGDWLNPLLPQYARYGDWRGACAAALGAPDARSQYAKAFFEAHFRPVELSTRDGDEGLLTGYYEPELDVREVATPEFSEPILAKPEDDAQRLQPRRLINATTSRVIAYGRPADVFFMQIQGSGRIRYGDGRVLRAAYAGHNGEPYTSIGRKLIEWGELDKGKASKGAIEAWMAREGHARAKALMNENARYIFFEEQSIAPGTGPNGAMRVPLTGMGSIALDPRYHPYGTVAVLETTLPRRPRDFRGEARTILVVGQDTGGAIKGPLRADLFFGAGDAAGRLAGVQKHPVRWTILVPRALAPAVPDS